MVHGTMSPILNFKKIIVFLYELTILAVTTERLDFVPWTNDRHLQQEIMFFKSVVNYK